MPTKFSFNYFLTYEEDRARVRFARQLVVQVCKIISSENKRFIRVSIDYPCQKFVD